MKGKTQNLKKYNAAYYFLVNNSISTVAELEERVNALSSQTGELLSKMNANTTRAKQLQDMINLGTNAQRLQPLIEEMNAIHWKGTRDKFRANHKADIDLYYTSKRVLKANHGVTKIDLPSWEKEQKSLRQQDEELSAQYKSIRKTLDQLLNVRRCVEATKKEIEREISAKSKDIQRYGI